MDKEFWENKWQAENQGWDMGCVSPPIKRYVDLIKDKNLRILIPGAGNAYEAEYLFEQGFKNVYVIDITDLAVENFKKRCPDFPADQVIRGDYFELDTEFDLIIEQTFFCAIDPSLREKYCNKMHELLRENGKLVGLLFNFPLETGPPFGGDVEDYQALFESQFSKVSIVQEKGSIKPRQGREVWIEVAH